MRLPSSFRGPLHQRRLALASIAAGSLVAGLGAYARYRPGSEAGSWTFLAETAGLCMAVAGALWEARVADRLVPSMPAAVQRRALLLLALGLVTGLAGCAAASAVQPEAVRGTGAALATTAIVFGIGRGLAGLITLLWLRGVPYAGERIERLSRED